MALDAPASAGGTLGLLNDDVLLQLADFLAGKNLMNLSMTCRRMRFLYIHVLFSTACIESCLLSSSPTNPVPDDIRGHVRTLKLIGLFDRQSPDRSVKGRQSRKMARELELCTAKTVSSIIRSPPHLQSVTISDPRPCLGYRWFGRSLPRAGVPLHVIFAILRASRVQHFVVHGLLYHKDDPVPPLPPSSFLLRHIKTFRYTPFTYREGPRAYASELALLKVILPAISASVAVLHLPLENAPLHEMSLIDWPRLRELVFEGEHLALVGVKPTPYIAFLARMPLLRRLRFHVADVFDHPLNTALFRIEPPPPVWPVFFPSMEFTPLQALEALTVSHPRIEDQLWAHLPSGLRELRVVSWPYRNSLLALYDYPESNLMQSGLDWRSPLFSSWTIRRIVDACRGACNLTVLEIEYAADNDEQELLKAVTRTFPALQSLTLVRDDAEDEGTRPPWERIVAIANALRCLRDLRGMRMHIGWNENREIGLDAFLEAPAEIQAEAARLSDKEPRMSKWCLDLIAMVFLRVLGPSIDFVDLSYSDVGSRWLRFRPSGPGRRMRAEELEIWL